MAKDFSSPFDIYEYLPIFSDVANTSGQFQYSNPSLQGLLQGDRSSTANILTNTNVGTGDLGGILGIDTIPTRDKKNKLFGRGFDIKPTYGLSYQDIENLSGSALYNKEGREFNANIEDIYAKYFKDNNNQSSLDIDYKTNKGGAGFSRNSNVGDSFRGNIRPFSDTEFSFKKGDDSQEVSGEWRPAQNMYVGGEAVNTDDGNYRRLSGKYPVDDRHTVSGDIRSGPYGTGYDVRADKRLLPDGLLSASFGKDAYGGKDVGINYLKSIDPNSNLIADFTTNLDGNTKAQLIYEYYFGKKPSLFR
tara:strand:- start:17 stop:928 length:912 start_codon:yes stop_codon:yes gene_type:complete